MSNLKEFVEFREKVNKIIIEKGTLNTKRFFNIDENVYNEGKLPKKTKELLGLVASIVLRCDDCVNYHLLQLKNLKTDYEEFFEAFDIALVVGGSITIPHIRRAVMFLEEIMTKEEN
ncbi:MAG: carboxymuconolactone decarboxylase family protein [Thermoanaerobaculaceae bacterium]|nr:carboxymuconolactone decarboxylase family protein [Thermoanaerobaculaceae bacterium]